MSDTYQNLRGFARSLNVNSIQFVNGLCNCSLTGPVLRPLACERKEISGSVAMSAQPTRGKAANVQPVNGRFVDRIVAGFLPQNHNIIVYKRI